MKRPGIWGLSLLVILMVTRPLVHSSQDQKQPPVLRDPLRLVRVEKQVYQAPPGNGVDDLRLAFRPVDLPDEAQGPSGLVTLLSAKQSIPVSLAHSDFNEDQMPDLVTGYAVAFGGVVTIRLGERESVFPTRRYDEPEIVVPFGAEMSFAVPIAPEFLVAGDFNNDGHRDVLLADSNFPRLVLLAGDRRGMLRQPEIIPIDGRPTALLAGDFGRRDGLDDLAVAMVTEQGPTLSVWQNPAGALTDSSDVLKLPSEAVAIEAGFLNSEFDTRVDLVIAAEDQLILQRFANECGQ